MDVHERRVAQIVRDFMEAYALAEQIGRRLRAGDLEYSWIKRLVADSEESALYRLKEECHALFRADTVRPKEEFQAEELFDLAVGALFHEAMKLREGYYLTTTYGPRLEEMVREGKAAGPLAKAFQRVFEAGRQRMHESEAQAQELFGETRDQLLVVIRTLPDSGAVARSILEHPVRAEAVFGIPLRALLESVYGSTARGYELAIDSLIESGHFSEVASLLQRRDAVPLGAEYCDPVRRLARGLEEFYAANVSEALDFLEDWVEAGAVGTETWRALARRVLQSVQDAPDPEGEGLETRAKQLADRLNSL